MSHKLIYPKLKKEENKLWKEITNDTYVEIAEDVEKWIRKFQVQKSKE